MYQVITYRHSGLPAWQRQAPVVLRRKLYRWRWMAKLVCDCTQTLCTTGCYWKEWRPHLRLVK